MIALVLQLTAAFNLVCAGTHRWGETNSREEPRHHRPFETTIRVDLDSGRWCEDDCTIVSPIARVTATEIVFRVFDDGQGGGDLKMLNRETGEYGDRMLIPSINSPSFISTRNGICRQVPFTGIPPA